MIGTKLYWVEIRIGEGTIQETFAGRDFMPDSPLEEWPWFRVVGENKDKSIDEVIAKLQSLKDSLLPIGKGCIEAGTEPA